MKFKFRNLLIGTGIAVLGVAAAGAAVGISEKKSDKPDTSDTMTENLDLINLIGDLQSQINSVNTENEQIKNQLNSVKNENNTLKNQLNSIFDSNINVNGNISATEGNFNSIQVGETEFAESDLNRNAYRYSFNLMHCSNYVDSITEFNNTNYLSELGDQFGYLYATLWTFYIDSSIYLTDNELSAIKTWIDIENTFNIGSNYDYPIIKYRGCYANKNGYIDQTAYYHSPGITYTDNSDNNGGICIMTEYNDASYISYKIMFQTIDSNANTNYIFTYFSSDFDSDCLMVQDYSIVDKNL